VGGRAFSIVYSLIGIMTMSFFLSSLLEMPSALWELYLQPKLPATSSAGKGSTGAGSDITKSKSRSGGANDKMVSMIKITKSASYVEKYNEDGGDAEDMYGGGGGASSAPKDEADEFNESNSILSWVCCGDNVLLHSTVIATLYLLVMGYLLQLDLESEWSLFNSCYFLFISFSGIGLGDFAPKHDSQDETMGVLVLGLALFISMYVYMESKIASLAANQEYDEDGAEKLQAVLQEKEKAKQHAAYAETELIDRARRASRNSRTNLAIATGAKPVTSSEALSSPISSPKSPKRKSKKESMSKLTTTTPGLNAALGRGASPKRNSTTPPRGSLPASKALKDNTPPGSRL
jgi:hypothetical protein